MTVFLKDVATYAIRGNGKSILLIGTVLALAQELVSFAPILGFVAAILLLGYFMSVYIQMIETTATGSDQAPLFPEMTNILSDVIAPLFTIIGVIILTFLPVIIFEWLVDPAPGISIVGNVLFWLGLIYLPMAILAVVVLGHFGTMSPLIVIPAIKDAGLLYWVGIIILAVLYFMESVIATALAEHSLIRVLVIAPIGVFMLMTNARVLGLIYREKKEELNWL